MSMGQMIGGGAGFLIGAVFGQAALGMSIGGLIGQWLLPPDAPDPDPLGDLGINSFVRDTVVPVVIGKDKVYGGVIFIGDNWNEVTNDGSNKQPNFATVFHCQFAVALSEGEINSFIKYYLNDNDISELKEEDHVNLTFTTYNGTSGQALNSAIESFLSEKKYTAVPWRNTAYVFCDGEIGKQNSLPTFAADIKGLFCESGEDDANPIVACYEFMTNKRWGMGIATTMFDGNPYSGSGTWRTEKLFCDELVNYKDGTQPRFRYSKTFKDKQAGYDIIRDILQTCRAFIYYSQGKLYVKIEKQTEEPVFYFSDGYELTRTAGAGSTVDRLYANFSTMPTNFFAGDLGWITIGSASYSFCVTAQTDTYLDLGESLPVAVSEGDSFRIRKENIAKDTFTYRKKPTAETNNRVRFEFINRDDEWRSDFVEVDNTASIVEIGDVNEITVSMEGVKRKSQAARLATYLCDYNNFVEYFAEFQTDIVGYLFNVGDIVGIYSSITNWGFKKFRIQTMEELDDYNVKISLIEFNPSIYHDDSHPYSDTESYHFVNPYSKPSHVERLTLVEDPVLNRIYVCFKRPNTVAADKFWASAVCYLQSDLGASYAHCFDAKIATPSVELLSGINDSDTTIPYDPTTMYGSFPSSGSFWIDSEEIYYAAIDDGTDTFTGCVRGYNSTLAASHLADAMINLRKSNTPYYEYDVDSEIGATQTIKAISQTVYDIFADGSTAPTASIQIQGNKIKPPKPSCLKLNDIPGNTTLVSGDANLDWYLVTTGVNKAFGAEPYGDGSGYGGGNAEGVYQYTLLIYKKVDNTLLRTVEITNLATPTYTYAEATNTSDNGGVYNPDLKFVLYQENNSGLRSLPVTLITN